MCVNIFFSIFMFSNLIWPSINKDCKSQRPILSRGYQLRYDIEDNQGFNQWHLTFSGDPNTACTKIDWCGSSPCQNGGNCIDNNVTFSCSCQPGYQGSLCEEDIKECETAPCMNQGTCIERNGTFSCQCPTGWTGNVCENDVDECQSNPCQQGSCSNTVSVMAENLVENHQQE